MSPQKLGTAQDEQAIRDTVARFVTAWTKDDIRGMAACFAEDGDMINPAGRVARGREEIEELFAEEHSGHFKKTGFALPFKHLRFLKPDVAIADHEFEINGIQSGPTTALSGLLTLVLRKNADSWLIASARPMVPANPPKQRA